MGSWLPMEFPVKTDQTVHAGVQADLKQVIL